MFPSPPTPKCPRSKCIDVLESLTIAQGAVSDARESLTTCKPPEMRSLTKQQRQCAASRLNASGNAVLLVARSRVLEQRLMAQNVACGGTARDRTERIDGPLDQPVRCTKACAGTCRSRSRTLKFGRERNPVARLGALFTHVAIAADCSHGTRSWRSITAPANGDRLACAASLVHDVVGSSCGAGCCRRRTTASASRNSRCSSDAWSRSSRVVWRFVG